MEKIVNYKIKNFFIIQDYKLIVDYLSILDNLNPLRQIQNPKYKWYKIKESKTIQIPSILELTFGEVTEIRNSFGSTDIESIIDSVMMLTKLKRNEVLNFTIIQFYGIISSIKADLIQIQNMEFNELSNDEDDINVELTNANERMSKYGILNVFDNLSNGDITKWNKIEKMQYLTVFTKLSLDNTKAKIQKEISELQKKQIKK
ncbi:hypothetical protein [Flavobacterium muglaense]|uniref:Uncharacterized protein n=1 Tax=Flavobacterium muglaense TaxID=2764716 RepID=A0A923SE94_9FLAO|nr:hypothetical protein [Flavobacterium muglaense]MBC5836784.1 hypothetical protein [Flavobacterium muglaense]MBC5843266.1 hypothetical protein [Flavobacterium muglaense]